MEEKYGTKQIRESKLEAFPHAKEDLITVKFIIPEFTCLCPRSGFPDFATIRITYIPNELCVELKSLKLWINSFRDKAIYHEDVASAIGNALQVLLKPQSISVEADFNVRGNIHTVVTWTRGGDFLHEKI